MYLNVTDKIAFMRSFVKSYKTCALCHFPKQSHLREFIEETQDKEDIAAQLPNIIITLHESIEHFLQSPSNSQEKESDTSQVPINVLPNLHQLVRFTRVLGKHFKNQCWPAHEACDLIRSQCARIYRTAYLSNAKAVTVHEAQLADVINKCLSQVFGLDCTSQNVWWPDCAKSGEDLQLRSSEDFTQFNDKVKVCNTTFDKSIL